MQNLKSINKNEASILPNAFHFSSNYQNGIKNEKVNSIWSGIEKSVPNPILGAILRF